MGRTSFMTARSAPGAQPGPRWLRRVALACGLALLLGYVPHHVYGRTGLARLLELRHSLAELRRKNNEARAENTRLRGEAAALKGDPRALERVARDELGLVKQGETVYEFAPGTESLSTHREWARGGAPVGSGAGADGRVPPGRAGGGGGTEGARATTSPRDDRQWTAPP
jgi:cell division protein FtsB